MSEYWKKTLPEYLGILNDISSARITEIVFDTEEKTIAVKTSLTELQNRLQMTQLFEAPLRLISNIDMTIKSFGTGQPRDPILQHKINALTDLKTILQEAVSEFTHGSVVLSEDVERAISPAFEPLVKISMLPGPTSRENLKAAIDLGTDSIGMIPIIGTAISVLGMISTLAQHFKRTSKLSDGIDRLKHFLAFRWYVLFLEKRGIAAIDNLVNIRERQCQPAFEMIKIATSGFERIMGLKEENSF